MRLLVIASGTDSPTKLSDELKLSGRHAPQRVTRWRRGENEPDFEATIAVLSYLGWLKEDEIRSALVGLQAVDGEAVAAQGDAIVSEELERQALPEPKAPRRRRSA